MRAVTPNSTASLANASVESPVGQGNGVAAKEYENWGGEFVDDALRFGEHAILRQRASVGETALRQFHHSIQTTL
jgi:hypothetical protein